MCAMAMEGNASTGSSHPAQSPFLSAHRAQAALVLIQETKLPKNTFTSHITLTGSRLPINAPYSTSMLSTGKLFIAFHPLVD